MSAQLDAIDHLDEYKRKLDDAEKALEQAKQETKQAEAKKNEAQQVLDQKLAVQKDAQAGVDAANSAVSSYDTQHAAELKKLMSKLTARPCLA